MKTVLKHHGKPVTSWDVRKTEQLPFDRDPAVTVMGFDFASKPDQTVVRIAVAGKSFDVNQIVYALERQADALSDLAVGAQQTYAAEFPAEDADRMREAIDLLRALVPPSATPTL